MRLHRGFFCGNKKVAASYLKTNFMAEIQTATSSHKHGKPTRKRLSTRIDLTPMVDLGFLLITFFIFTTALSTPSVMKLNLPVDDVEDKMTVSKNKVFTLVLGKNNSVGYYFGSDAAAMQFTNYSGAGIRAEIQRAQQQVARKFGDKLELFTLIKPTPESSYKNVVDALDEMLINGVKRYVLTEADAAEVKMTDGK